MRLWQGVGYGLAEVADTIEAHDRPKSGQEPARIPMGMYDPDYMPPPEPTPELDTVSWVDDEVGEEFTLRRCVLRQLMRLETAMDRGAEALAGREAVEAAQQAQDAADDRYRMERDMEALPYAPGVGMGGMGMGIAMAMASDSDDDTLFGAIPNTEEDVFLVDGEYITGSEMRYRRRLEEGVSEPSSDSDSDLSTDDDPVTFYDVTTPQGPYRLVAGYNCDEALAGLAPFVQGLEDGSETLVGELLAAAWSGVLPARPERTAHAATDPTTRQEIHAVHMGIRARIQARLEGRDPDAENKTPEWTDGEAVADLVWKLTTAGKIREHANVEGREARPQAYVHHVARCEHEQTLYALAAAEREHERLISAFSVAEENAGHAAALLANSGYAEGSPEWQGGAGMVEEMETVFSQAAAAVVRAGEAATELRGALLALKVEIFQGRLTELWWGEFNGGKRDADEEERETGEYALEVMEHTRTAKRQRNIEGFATSLEASVLRAGALVRGRDDSSDSGEDS